MASCTQTKERCGFKHFVEIMEIAAVKIEPSWHASSRRRLTVLSWGFALSITIVAVVAAVTVDRLISASGDRAVLSAFQSDYIGHAAGFKTFLGALERGLRLTADAIGSHGSLPTTTKFATVS